MNPEKLKKLHDLQQSSALEEQGIRKKKIKTDDKKLKNSLKKLAAEEMQKHHVIEDNSFGSKKGLDQYGVNAIDRLMESNLVTTKTQEVINLIETKTSSFQQIVESIRPVREINGSIIPGQLVARIIELLINSPLDPSNLETEQLIENLVSSPLFVKDITLNLKERRIPPLGLIDFCSILVNRLEQSDAHCCNIIDLICCLLDSNLNNLVSNIVSNMDGLEDKLTLITQKIDSILRVYQKATNVKNAIDGFVSINSQFEPRFNFTAMIHPENVGEYVRDTWII